ncbi:hypothetical protein EDC04DRAFT_3068534 [Pisolithus marmoratus]|nr:hypothetical protein EDC04DRAFT_3068534 [Pisolithus marmoratus]
MPTPLPPNPFPGNAFYGAYERCLALEAAAPNLRGPPHCPPPIVCARLLGHLLRLATGNGQGQVQREITSAEDNEGLMTLAGFYLSHFIHVFKRSSGPTPQPSDHPSRPSFEEARQYALAIMQPATLDHRTARAAARHRDGGRCILTGRPGPDAGGFAVLNAAHIIPGSTNRNIGEEGNKRFHSGGAWAMLSMFTDVNILEQLAGNLIHRVENIMMIDVSCHHYFDELSLWLKPVEGLPHTYRVCEAHQGLKQFLGIPDMVTFSTKTEHALPHPAFLAVHALCCEVAWMSGAAEYLIDIERRMDQTSVLAKDGSTADVLSRALGLVRC